MFLAYKCRLVGVVTVAVEIIGEFALATTPSVRTRHHRATSARNRKGRVAQFTGRPELSTARGHQSYGNFLRRRPDVDVPIQANHTPGTQRALLPILRTPSLSPSPLPPPFSPLSPPPFLLPLILPFAVLPSPPPFSAAFFSRGPVNPVSLPTSPGTLPTYALHRIEG